MKESQKKSKSSSSDFSADAAKYLATTVNYHQVREPDIDELVKLATRAKGPSRSLRQFSDDVEVSPATMSRILNGNIPKGIRHDIMARIVAAADPQSNVTIEMLLKANGEDDSPKVRHSEAMTVAFEQTAKTAILTGLLDRGYSVREVREGPEQTGAVVKRPMGPKGPTRQGPGYSISFDFELKTDALEQGKDSTWLFEIKHDDGRGSYSQFISMVMSAYYCGTADAKRISLVIDNKDTFKRLKTTLEELRIPDEISVILIQNNIVVEEYLTPTTEGTHNEDVFFPIQRSKGAHRKDTTEEIWDMDDL